jgi:hypothetical protein
MLAARQDTCEKGGVRISSVTALGTLTVYNLVVISKTVIWYEVKKA